LAAIAIWRWRILAGLLIVASATIRVAYLAGSCPLDLAPDEAHYWDWSRHLDWSYYSKGPLVALLIRSGTSFAGLWPGGLVVAEMVAVRLPAVLCGSLLLVSLYMLTQRVFGREPLAAAVVAAALSLPVVGAGSTLMTIDAPYTCCWGWALVLGHQAIFRRSAWAWPAAGLMVGVGILAKYTMVLWLPSVGLFLLTSAVHRRWLFRPGFWVATTVAAACCLPILLWNWAHDWVSVRHVHGLAGLHDEAGMHWSGPLVYLGTQCGLFLVFWFIAWLAAMIAHRPWVEPDAGVRYLWWTSAPMFVVFLAFSPKTGGGEPNWPVTAYISGLVLAAAWLSQQLRSPCRWYRRWTLANLIVTCAAGVAVTILMHHSDWVYPLLGRLSGPPTAARPLPLRQFDPTCRLRGWHMTLAAEVDRLRVDLGASGEDPILACTNWSLPGELAFYCQGHPTVYSVGLALGDRHSQYDFWHPNPLSEPDAFAGRTFILVGDLHPDLRQAFDSLETPRLVVHKEQGQPIAAWGAVVARGFRGFRHARQVGERPSF
jgi:4-amino-4-deoxy-L-arabinose transferase-like glycosyltransferase